MNRRSATTPTESLYKYFTKLPKTIRLEDPKPNAFVVNIEETVKKEKEKELEKMRQELAEELSEIGIGGSAAQPNVPARTEEEKPEIKGNGNVFPYKNRRRQG
eukprot:TRINITY_DN3529_c0_g2_i2.p3 TRINITY_DN3529_c0_g2~~TRINITY_DN3529_c0_g2_i2.p3  ORF type:complete len:119 (+),score=16.26 TRINITY_DN3529_c0_g2_i2:49-357(+)